MTNVLSMSSEPFTINKQVAIKPVQVDKIEAADTGSGFMKNVSRGNVQEVDLAMGFWMDELLLRPGQHKVLVSTEFLSTLSGRNIMRLGSTEFYLIPVDRVIGYVR